MTVANTTYGIIFSKTMIDDTKALLKPLRVHKRENKRYFPDEYKNTNENEEYGFDIEGMELLEYMNEHKLEIKIEVADALLNTWFAKIKNYTFIMDTTKDKSSNNCCAVNMEELVSFNTTLNQDIVTFIRSLPSNETITFQGEISDLIKSVTQRVVGQEEAAYKLITTIYKNLKYYKYEGMKSNILLYGPSGCGKTELLRSISKAFNVPLVIADITSFTASGYVGDSAKKVLYDLYEASDEERSVAEHGIIVLDEFDKLASTDPRHTVNKTDVQQEFLKIIEGGVFTTGNDQRNMDSITIDTTNITFVLCGAFQNLVKPKRNITVGFTNSTSPLEQNVEISNETFVEYGILTELVGRLPVKIGIKSLDKEDYKRILRSSSISCLKMYEEAFLDIDMVKIIYDNKEEVIDKIATEAEKLKIGARSLKTVVDQMFLPASGEIDLSKPYPRELLITKETVINPSIYTLTDIIDEKQERVKRKVKTW